MTKEELREHAMALYDFCEYPAVRYKLLFSILDTPYEDESLRGLREQFLKSDIVEEMYQLQDEYGGWGAVSLKRLFRQGKNTDIFYRDKPVFVYRIDDSRQRYFVFGKRISAFAA